MELLQDDVYGGYEKEDTVKHISETYSPEDTVSIFSDGNSAAVSSTEGIEASVEVPDAEEEATSILKQEFIDTILVVDDEIRGHDDYGLRASDEELINGEIVKEFFKSSLWCSAVALGR